MAGPPTDVTPAELFTKIQEPPRPSEVVNFPRRTPDGKPVGTVRIQVLPMREHTRARKAALEKATSQHKLSREDRDSGLGLAIVNDAVACELLAVACRTEQNHGNEEKPFYPVIFPTAEAIADLLSADEIAVLFNCYLLVQAKWGPFEKTIQTEQELSEWIKRLVEGAAEFPLAQLSSAPSAELPSLLARRAYTLSVILESLFSSLPNILKSRLGIYSLGTGFFGLPAADTSEAPTGTSPSLRVADAEITIEDAKQFALQLKNSESAAIAALDAAEEMRDTRQDEG